VRRRESTESRRYSRRERLRYSAVAQTFQSAVPQVSGLLGVGGCRARNRVDQYGDAQPTESRRYSRRERLRYSAVAQTFQSAVPQVSGLLGVGGRRARSRVDQYGDAQSTESRRYSRRERLRYSPVAQNFQSAVPQVSGLLGVGGRRARSRVDQYGDAQSTESRRYSRRERLRYSAVAQTFQSAVPQVSGLLGVGGRRARSRVDQYGDAQPTESRRYSRRERLRYSAQRFLITLSANRTNLHFEVWSAAGRINAAFGFVSERRLYPAGGPKCEWRGTPAANRRNQSPLHRLAAQPRLLLE